MNALIRFVLIRNIQFVGGRGAVGEDVVRLLEMVLCMRELGSAKIDLRAGDDNGSTLRRLGGGDMTKDLVDTSDPSIGSGVSKLSTSVSCGHVLALPRPVLLSVPLSKSLFVSAALRRWFDGEREKWRNSSLSGCGRGQVLALSRPLLLELILWGVTSDRVGNDRKSSSVMLPIFSANSVSY